MNNLREYLRMLLDEIAKGEYTPIDPNLDTIIEEDNE